MLFRFSGSGSGKSTRPRKLLVSSHGCFDIVRKKKEKERQTEKGLSGIRENRNPCSRCLRASSASPSIYRRCLDFRKFIREHARTSEEEELDKTATSRNFLRLFAANAGNSHAFTEFVRFQHLVDAKRLSTIAGHYVETGGFGGFQGTGQRVMVTINCVKREDHLLPLLAVL